MISLRDYINNSKFYVVVPNEYCVRGDALLSVHWVDIEKTDTKAAKIMGESWEKLVLNSTTSKVSCAWICQSAWTQLHRYIETGS